MNEQDVRRRGVPRELLIRAALIVAVYTALRLAGARPYVSFLSGTFHAPAGGAHWTTILGILFVFAHLAVTILAPILTIAAGLLWAVERLRERKKEL